MKLRLLKVYKSFRFKILLSFFMFIAIILIWVYTYFLILEKQKQIKDFKANLTSIQNRFLENNRNLEYFILVGFHQPSFYATEKQKDIDTFLSEQSNEINYLEWLKNDASAKKIKIDSEITASINLNKILLDSVSLLKKIYFEKGYQYYGTEGKMWRYAHVLDDSTDVPKVDILQLRRREKDYLLRGDQKYINEHNDLTAKLLLKYPPGTPAGDVITNYRKYFQLLVTYTDRLGIANTNGIYYHVQDGINKVEQQYALTKLKGDAEVSNMQNSFNNILLAVSAFLVLAAILLSWNVSHFLTKDIKKLNSKISVFVKSRFKDDPNSEDDDFVHSKITEIDQLNDNYLQLKETLKTTLAHLENSIQKEKKASLQKSIFVANISHEIRTPLTGIIGMVHLLKGSSVSEEQVELIESLDFSANHLQELINMVLDYSKIEAGKVELENIPFDLKGDIAKLVKLFEYKVIEKGLTLQLDYRVHSPYYVMGDPVRFQQILLNLLNNAIKFTPTGFIELRVIPVFVNEDLVHVRFEVEDSGIGIAIHEIDKLFEAFNQANTAISRQFGGTGLGLTISNQLIRLMGGELKVQSEREKGSIFSFELKFRTGGKIIDRMIDTGENGQNMESLRILLAEDNKINQIVILKMLNKYAAKVDVANNGIEAVDLFNENDYDLVLMDLQMPEMDGFEASTTICMSDKYQEHYTPIVAFSAIVYDEDRRRAKEAGMDDFITKPVIPNELAGIIAKYGKKRML